MNDKHILIDLCEQTKPKPPRTSQYKAFSSKYDVGLGIFSHNLWTEQDNYHGAANDAAVALEGDERVADVDGGLSVGIGLDVAEIAGVATSLGISGSAMFATVGVEVGTGGGAAIGVVAELVDVEAVKARSKSEDLARHGHGSIAL